MKGSQALHKSIRVSLIFAVIVSLTTSFLAAEELAYTPTQGSYHYSFVVNDDGFTWVTVNYENSENRGSSWVLVPKFSGWDSTILSGQVLRSELVESVYAVGEEYYFYQVFSFSFQSDESFKMSIRFNMSAGALIIEPRGVFFSPLIGFQEGSIGEAEVFLPTGSRVVEALALGSVGNYAPKKEASNHVLFDLKENLIRLQIEFKTSISTPEFSTLKQGVFTLQTVRRYENYASGILHLFNTVYDSLVDLFNVTLESVDIRFIIPEFYVFLSIGGYVPFTGGKVGDIHINVFFIRGVRGVLEVIALHELVHHFLSKAGLSPSDFLWFHEGMAQYVSVEVADELGYEGASTERDKLRLGTLQLAHYGENFNFLQEWTPEIQPADVTTCYVASYYVVSKLAEKYGGLDYYKRFFKLISGTHVEDNDVLAHYLSLAANTSVAPDLRRWGFDIVDLYGFPTLVDEAERAVYGLSSVFQPYKFLAERLYEQGLTYLEIGDAEKADQYIKASISLAKFAPILTLITVAAILLVVIYILRRKPIKAEQSSLLRPSQRAGY